MTFFQGRGQVGSNLSIDRIDNNKTYSKDNITFCTQNFNHKKGQLTLELIKKILEVFKKKGIDKELNEENKTK
jgi:adenine/guanine phosphoribosyltransferase-like PRPP-binding protein